MLSLSLFFFAMLRALMPLCRLCRERAFRELRTLLVSRCQLRRRRCRHVTTMSATLPPFRRAYLLPSNTWHNTEGGMVWLHEPHS